MIVISNASPLIALSRISREDILQHLFGHLLIPEAVHQEVVLQCPHPDEKARLQEAIAEFIEIVHPTFSHVFSRNLGHGEREVLNVALEMRPDILLIDDKRARYEAQELGFFPTFTADVLKEAERQGLISSYQEILQELYNQEIYLPE